MSRLLKAARIGLGYVELDLAMLIEAHCLMNPDLTPDHSTLDEGVRPLVEKRQADIAEIRAAIAEADLPEASRRFLTRWREMSQCLDVETAMCDSELHAAADDLDAILSQVREGAVH